MDHQAVPAAVTAMPDQLGDQLKTDTVILIYCEQPHVARVKTNLRLAEFKKSSPT